MIRPTRPIFVATLLSIVTIAGLAAAQDRHRGTRAVSPGRAAQHVHRGSDIDVSAVPERPQFFVNARAEHGWRAAAPGAPSSVDPIVRATRSAPF